MRTTQLSGQRGPGAEDAPGLPRRAMHHCPRASGRGRRWPARSERPARRTDRRCTGSRPGSSAHVTKVTGHPRPGSSGPCPRMAPSSSGPAQRRSSLIPALPTRTPLSLGFGTELGRRHARTRGLGALGGSTSRSSHPPRSPPSARPGPPRRGGPARHQGNTAHHVTAQPGREKPGDHGGDPTGPPSAPQRPQEWAGSHWKGFPWMFRFSNFEHPTQALELCKLEKDTLQQRVLGLQGGGPVPAPQIAG